MKLNGDHASPTVGASLQYNTNKIVRHTNAIEYKYCLGSLGQKVLSI